MEDSEKGSNVLSTLNEFPEIFITKISFYCNSEFKIVNKAGLTSIQWNMHQCVKEMRQFITVVIFQYWW